VAAVKIVTLLACGSALMASTVPKTITTQDPWGSSRGRVATLQMVVATPHNIFILEAMVMVVAVLILTAVATIKTVSKLVSAKVDTIRVEQATQVHIMVNQATSWAETL